MGNNNLRFEPQPVFSAILEGGQTFMELAKKYGLNVKEFERLLREKVGEKDFYRLQKASKQNWLKKRPKPKRAKSESKPSKAEPTMPSRNELLKQKEEAEQRIQELTLETEEEASKIAKADAKIAEAEAALRMAKKEKNIANDRFSRKMEKLEKWTKKSNAIAELLQEIDNRVYLVAPGYQGKLPDAGKLVSVVSSEGMEVESGGELLNEPTVEELLNSGYELISDARNAYNFARLVTKYQFEGIESNVLVDDERLKKILEAQGLEF